MSLVMMSWKVEVNSISSKWQKYDFIDAMGVWKRKEWCDRNWTCHIYLPLNVGVPLKMATKESICLTLSAVQILDGRLNFNPKNAKFSSQSTIFPVRCQFFRMNKELCVWPHDDRNQTSTNMFWVLSEEVHVRSEQSEIRTGGRTSDSLMTFATRYPCVWRWQFLKCFQSSRQTPLQNETTHFVSYPLPRLPEMRHWTLEPSSQILKAKV